MKYDFGLVQRVGNAISVTNKLLAFNELILIPYRKEKKWGFCDKNKKIKIECKYDEAYPYSEGLALVKMLGDYFFIDSSENKIVYCNKSSNYSFDKNGEVLQEGFKNGVTVVYSKVSEKYGVIDKNNSVILSCSFSKIEYFDKFILATEDTDTQLTFSYQGVSLNQESFWQLGSFGEGLARAYNSNSFGKYYGFISDEGKLVLDCIFESLEIMGNLEDKDFSCGLASVFLNGKRGFIDKKGKWLFESHASKFSDGLANSWIHPFRAGEYKFINIAGETEFEGSYDYVNDFSEGLCNVKMKDRFGFINKKGRLVIDFLYEAAKSFHDGLALVKLNKKWGAIDKKGQTIIDFKYDADFIYPDDFRNGVVNLKYEGKWVQINSAGQIIINGEYDEIKTIDELYTEVTCYNNSEMPFPSINTDNTNGITRYLENKRENYRYGLVNRNGEVVISLQYNSMKKINDDLLRICWQNNSSYAYIDINETKYWED